MRRLVAVLVVSIVSLCAAPAIAAAPKHGYYIDPKLQVYVVVNASRTALSSFQAPCMVKDTTSGALSQSGGFLLKTKHPKLSPSGSFSYSGNVTLQSDRKSVVKAERLTNMMPLET